QIFQLFGGCAPVGVRLAGKVAKWSGVCLGRFPVSASINPAACGATRCRFSYKNPTVESTPRSREHMKDPEIARRLRENTNVQAAPENDSRNDSRVAAARIKVI